MSLKPCSKHVENLLIYSPQMWQTIKYTVGHRCTKEYPLRRSLFYSPSQRYSEWFGSFCTSCTSYNHHLTSNTLLRIYKDRTFKLKLSLSNVVRNG